MGNRHGSRQYRGGLTAPFNATARGTRQEADYKVGLIALLECAEGRIQSHRDEVGGHSI
jgi:hypothetical protein